MTIPLDDLVFVLGEICLMLGGYALYTRHKIAKGKKRHREFLAWGES
jgi:hypothetical protein